MAQLQSTSITDPGSIEIPAGTTAERPGFVVQMFTATGPGTFTVPTGVSSVDVLVVGGGGAGGGIGGGGGAGGVVYRPALPVTPGGTISYAVGAGGISGGGYTIAKGNSGANSTFGSLTALGGGGAGAWASPAPQPGGGSGAGGTAGSNGGTAGQPAQPNTGATINAGFPGAAAGPTGTPGALNATTGVGLHTNGGGGGAGSAGGHPTRIGPGNTSADPQAGRQGGAGIVSSITGLNQHYGGGGGGGSHVSGYQSPVTLAEGGLGGGGRGASVDFQYDAMGFYDFPATAGAVTTHNPRASGVSPGPVGLQPYGYGEPGVRNTGGGGGGGYHTGVGGDADGGGGGPGVIIVRYVPPNTDAAEAGMLRYNTDSRITEIYNGTIWKPLKTTVVEFRATGSHFFKVPSGVTVCDVLVVAGGGAGGILGGGGGAGGHLYVPNHPISPGGTIPVFVGVGGGAQQDTSAPPFNVANKGQPSRFGGIEAYGGGTAAVHPGNGNNYPGYPTAGFATYPGGSGGSASSGGSGGGAAYTHPGGWGRGVPGQGFPGGDTPGSPPHGCGGGGGAGGVGGAGGGNPAGAGGVGVANSITGVPVTRAGGGGGGGHAPQSNGGAGGAGGGGGGGRYNNPVHAAVYGFHSQSAGDYAYPGADNTGGGGGGSGHNANNPYGVGGRGGPGIVIIRY